MVDQLTLQTIGILLTGLTVSIAAIYYTLTLRYTRRNQELTLKTQEQREIIRLIPWEAQYQGQSSLIYGKSQKKKDKSRAVRVW